MYGSEFDSEEDARSTNAEAEPQIDYDADPIDVRDEAEDAEPPDEVSTDTEARRIDNADLDNVLDEFVDVVNARDLDGLGALLASDAQADFLGEMSSEGVVDGFHDLLLRNPSLLMTRGDLGSDPIVAVWTFDFETDRFDPFGYLTLDVSDAEQGRVQRVSHVEELSDVEDLVVESPDRSDLPEWQDWSELDED
jgi:hypothetical protein